MNRQKFPQQNNCSNSNDLKARVGDMQTQLDEMQKWREQQERKQKRERIDKRVQTGIGLVAPVAAGAAFVHYLGDTARGLGEFIGESYETLKVAKRILEPNARTKEVENYMARIDPSVRDSYLGHKDKGYLSRLETAIVETLDTGGRAGEKFPGAQTKPAKGLRDAKAWIIEKTKSIGKSEERKEEIATTNTQQYQENYNQIAALRLAAVGRLRELNSEIEEYCGKLAINEVKKGEINPRELETLEKLARQYSDIVQIAEGMKDLSVREINDGVQNQEYSAIIKQANDYGIKASDFSNYGDATLIGGTLVAAYLGHRIAKPATKLVQIAYKVARKGLSAIKKYRQRNNKA